VISATLFKNIFDNKTHRKLELSDFDTFEELLYGLSNVNRKGKKDAELISPAIYKANTTRANDNVTAWSSWCAIDVDDFSIHTGDVDHNLQRICGKYSYVCYSTASSTAIQPKFRLVFPLSKTLDKKDIPHFWYALNKQFEDIGDKQTKDLSRMYYVPAQYPDAFNFFYVNEGEHLDPDYIMSQWSYQSKTNGNFIDRLPPKIAEAVIAYRKEQMQAKDVVWSSYKNCPFFPKHLAAEYEMISDTGWYHKMYQIMVATAANAIKNDYPITAKEIADLCRELDMETGSWYTNRPLDLEADRAVEYAYRNV